MPFFSVVIPTYNRADFIVQTVNSVLAQDDQDFEVIIVDDGSTDATESVVAQNFGRLDKVRYCKQANSERGAARNLGINEARGRYVVFLDSDDLMHTDHLSALREIIEKNPGVNFLATKWDFIRDGEVRSGGLEYLKEGKYGTDLFLRGTPLGSVFCIRKDNPRLKPFEADRRYATSEDWMFMVQNLEDDEVYIGDRVTVSVNDHDNRSMRINHRHVIERKLLARDWVVEKVRLTESQVRVLDSHTYYFCGVHSYLDGRRADALKYLFKAVRRSGVSVPVGLLFVKSLLGYRLVQKIKGRLPGALHAAR